jgi:hypothetical protein
LPFFLLCRSLLAYLFVPLLQKELDVFKDNVWNTHRIRHQKDTYLPDGVPNHVYAFPEEYGLEECGKLIPIKSGIVCKQRGCQMIYCVGVAIHPS